MPNLTLHGQLTEEPLLQYTSSGKEVCNCKIITVKKETYNIVAWEQNALDLNKLQHGHKITCECYYKQQKWVSKIDGKEHKKDTFVIVKILKVK